MPLFRSNELSAGCWKAALLFSEVRFQSDPVLDLFLFSMCVALTLGQYKVVVDWRCKAKKEEKRFQKYPAAAEATTMPLYLYQT